MTTEAIKQAILERTQKVLRSQAIGNRGHLRVLSMDDMMNMDFYDAQLIILFK